MSHQLTPHSTIENLKKEAKRWLKALRANDADARARFERAHRHAPQMPALRDVQHALAREHGFPGWTALKRAVARIELERSAKPRSAAVAALLVAAEQGDVARVNELLDEYPDIIDERGDHGGGSELRTALHFGVAHEPVVRALLERGADPNIRDEGDDAIPLHFAAERGDIAVVRLLIEHGADPVGEGTVHELNVLGWAVCWDYTHHDDVAEYLLAHGARHTIHTAVALGAVDVIRELARHDPAELDRPMDRTNRRRRPLHLAVIKRRTDSLSALLALGADVEAVDAAGMTPLDQAALDGQTEMVRLLIERGAMLRLPAAIALQREHEVERLLRDDPGALKPGGRYATLIVRASEQAPARIIETLIRAGADVNAQDAADASVDQTEGYTALHAAAWNGNTEAAAVLLKHGADPNVRERKYCGTPAGWAAYAGHEETCRLILAADIDPFQAIRFGVAERLPAIVQRSPWALNRRFREYAPWYDGGDDSQPEPWHAPLAYAVARDSVGAVRALLEQGASMITAPDSRTLVQLARDAGYEQVAAVLQQYERFDETPAGRVRLFVKYACPDHDIRGAWAHVMAGHAAERLLRQRPEIARDGGFYTAVVCGDVAEVERVLAARPEAANERCGPKHWSPLLYLCFTRLSLPAANDSAVAIARLLLDHGADPNAYFMAGHSRYTPLVGAIGEGEEDRPPHARRDELVRLLLDRGAEPYDIQVIYNIHFHGRVLWFLQLMHEYSLRLGRASDWQDPDWSMLEMGGYGSGARWHLHIALEHNDLALAEWVLAHGANPNAAPARDPRLPQRSLYEDAVRRGLTDMAELLARYGASRVDVTIDPETEFAGACLRLDRTAASRQLAQHPELRQSPAALFAAAARNRTDVVAFLLELGVSVDVADEKNQRALHEAAYHDAADVAQLLIDRGAEVDPVEERWGGTPLGGAVHWQNRGAMDVLARYSRDVWHLTFTGHAERLRDVLAEEPDGARVSDDSYTPLMWLPDDEARALEVVELLLAHGADPNVRSSEGLTAADYAARRGLDTVAARLRG